MSREPLELPNMFFCCITSLFMLRGIYRFWRLNHHAALPYLLLVGVFPITYYLSHPLIDYRQPIEPAIVLLAIAGAMPFRALAAAKARVKARSQSQVWGGSETAPAPVYP